MRIAVELERIGQATSGGARDPTLGDESVELGSTGRQRAELRDRPVPVGDDQPFAALDAS